MRVDQPFETGFVLIVAAHPDDEVIGAGAQLSRLRNRISIVHATNGSPQNGVDAGAAGFASREHYAAGRRQELLEALALAGVSPERCREIGIDDQRASFHLPELTLRIAELIRELEPSIVLTHPYEGGHPDHDACAFAVQAARGMGAAFEAWEFTSYHMGPEGMHTGEFLPGSGSRGDHYPLTAAQRALKRRMFDCFRSQQQVLAAFGVDSESFRPAPGYDFLEAPHAGQLHYEQYDWGVTGARWRRLAGAALAQLGLNSHATHSA